MATVHYSVFVVILFVSQFFNSGAGDSLLPFIPSFSGNNSACREAVCGRGSCVASNSTVLGFVCKCDHGWIQAFDFGPCIIPNCTLNMDCGNSPAPAASINRPNVSFLEPCSWIDCGGGTCNKTSLFTHTCECEHGYHNLFNSSAFPCYRQCSFGLGCQNLGFNLTNSSSSTPPFSPSSNGSSNNGPRTELGWLISMFTSLGLIMFLDV